MAEESTTLWAAALYGVHTRTGRVDLSETDAQGHVRWHKQVSIDEARSYAMHVLEAAEAAETDEMLVALFTDRIGLPLERAAAVLRDFRTLRAARKG